MAVTTWVAVGQGVTPSTLGAVQGVVVNGGSTSGGGGEWTPPTEGRIYPGPRVLTASS